LAEYGADTSFLLRLLTEDPADQAKVAVAEVKRIAAKGGHIAVSDLVVMECYFALQAFYEVPKREAASAICCLFDTGVVVPEAGGQAHRILRGQSRASSKPGLVDRMIHARYHAEHQTFLTFEKSAAKLPGTRVLKG
jgi:predicted nucleic-acid-binding protein